MNEMRLTVEELAQMVNDYLVNVEIKDKRYAPLTKRRIDDYVTKGLLSKPKKEGNRNFYTMEHFNELITLRDLQANAGISESTLLKAKQGDYLTSSLGVATNTNSGDADLRNKALDIFANMNSQNKGLNVSGAMQAFSSVATTSTSSRLLQTLNQEYETGKSAIVNPQSGLLRGVGAFPTLNNQTQEEDGEKTKDFELEAMKKMEVTYELEDGLRVVVDESKKFQNKEKLKLMFEKILNSLK